MKAIRPINSEAEYDAALAAITKYFENQPEPGSVAAYRFNLLALVIEDYECERWRIDPPDPVA
jgi:HTH-type transcriptional regulator/antitoxin HigA